MNTLSLLNVVLLVYVASFFVVLEVNKRLLKGKSKPFNRMLKNGRKIHPYAGLALIIGGLAHGYNKLGGQIIFHTGTLLILLLIINGVIGFVYKYKRNKFLSRIHKFLGLLIVISFLTHYLQPWLFN